MKPAKNAGLLIAHVQTEDPPNDVRTFGQWLEWRATEDARMLRELRQQLDEWAAKQGAMEAAMVERDHSDATLQ